MGPVPGEGKVLIAQRRSAGRVVNPGRSSESGLSTMAGYVLPASAGVGTAATESIGRKTHEASLRVGPWGRCGGAGGRSQGQGYTGRGFDEREAQAPFSCSWRRPPR